MAFVASKAMEVGCILKKKHGDYILSNDYFSPYPNILIANKGDILFRLKGSPAFCIGTKDELDPNALFLQFHKNKNHLPDKLKELMEWVLQNRGLNISEN